MIVSVHSETGVFAKVIVVCEPYIKVNSDREYRCCLHKIGSPANVLC